MANDENKTHWVIRASIADRAGALTSIASAFSNRGVSIETIVGHGTAFPGAPGGAVIVTFWCSQSEKDEIVRVVARLSKVLKLVEHPYESESLRKSALVRTTRLLRPADVAGQNAFLTCELMEQRQGHWNYFLAGSPGELDAVLNRMVEQDILADVVYSVIGG